MVKRQIEGKNNRQIDKKNKRIAGIEKDVRGLNKKNSNKSLNKKVDKLISQTHGIDSDNNFIHFHGVRTHNLKNIDVSIPKNKLTVITGVSGSGKSSFAFDTLYKEGQYRYIESLSSYLRQFFNLGTRPDIDHCSGLSPAIAIEQNKRVGNIRSTVGTLTEIDDYIRLLFAKLGEVYCYGSGKNIKAQSIEQIMDDIKDKFGGRKIYLLKEITSLADEKKLDMFVKKNRNAVDKGKGFSRFLLEYTQDDQLQQVEYFYLEQPNIPEKYFPIKVYGIYDRLTVEESKMSRLKEDIIKILANVKKFGVMLQERNDQETKGISKKTTKGNTVIAAQIEAKGKQSSSKKKKDSEIALSLHSSQGQEEAIQRYTDKMYSADMDITYPEFTPQHFSPNRQEGACPECHGIGEVLQVDYDKILDPHSPYLKAILPWRDSAYGQAILKKLAQKYSISSDMLWKDMPERFLHVVINGDDELLRVPVGGKFVSVYYRGMEEILKEQFAKGLLTVDFQAMLDMKTCHACHGSKLRKESMHVFLRIKEDKLPKGFKLHKLENLFVNKSKTVEGRQYARPVDDGYAKWNIQDLHNMTLDQLVEFLKVFLDSSEQAIELIGKIIPPLLSRTEIINELGISYLTLTRPIDSLSGGEIQRLRLAKQLGNKLGGIIYVLDEPTIGLSDREIKKTINAIKNLQDLGNTIVVVEHNDEFIQSADRIVEIGPGAGDFGGNLLFSGPYEHFIKGDTLTARYIRGDQKIECELSHKVSKEQIKIKKASKYNLKDIDINIDLGSFTIITGASGAGKTTLMYSTLYRFLNDKNKFVQSYIRLQLLKKGWSWQEIISAPVMNPKDYKHYENMALQEFYKDIAVETIMGYDSIKNTVYVDQSSIGKTPRSCPATFVGTFDKIRTLYAGVNESKYLGFNSGHFSFNSSKGACPACKGYGYKKVELQFLPDTYVPCDLCNGDRYKQEIREIKWRGKGIHEVLDMYISDALVFFEEMSHIREELELLCDIGLGYLKMGQPAHTLSGGESQRLKLVRHLLKQYKGHTIYFLDEPTVGLHHSDIEKLLWVLKKFLDNGDTILMIEHDKSLLQFADQVIELEDGRLIGA